VDVSPHSFPMAGKRADPVATGIVLTFILSSKDVWFFHEHPRKINIWSTAIILSPFLGPQFMAAILSTSTWRTGMWLCFGLITLGLVCTIVLGEETFYPRHLPQEQIPQKK
jgi:MFS family permease